MIAAFTILFESQNNQGGLSFTSCAAATVKAIPRLFIVATIVIIIVAIGLYIYVIPGIAAYVVLCVSVQSASVERRGVSAILRSMELTSGARWKIFLILAILSIFAGVLVELGSLLSGDLAPSVQKALLVFVNVVSDIAWAVVHASMYIELRRWKEDRDPSSLASVFA
jgi:hypothetical protein